VDLGAVQPDCLDVGVLADPSAGDAHDVPPFFSVSEAVAALRLDPLLPALGLTSGEVFLHDVGRDLNANGAQYDE
jgi:hypothetical protein